MSIQNALIAFLATWLVFSLVQAIVLDEPLWKCVVSWRTTTCN